MAIRFYGKDGSQSGSCPSVSVDETGGSFLFVGWPLTDPALIAEIQTYSHIDPGEQAFLRCFDDLAYVAVYGSAARELIADALSELG
jgi:hypothetical protein